MTGTVMVQGSMAAVATREGQSLAETFLSAEVILIIDVSGSMETRDAPGGVTRHDAAARELRALQGSLPGKVAVVAFSSTVEFCPSDIPSRMNGSTDMAAALRFVKPADGTGIRFVMISDGNPDSELETLEVARTFTSRVDTVYIGPEDSRGRVFLEHLAAVTGGEFAQGEAPGLLQESVMQLLEGGM